MLFTERNTFSYTRVLCIKRSVEYDIPPFATIRRLAKLLVACPSAIRETGQTNGSLRSTQSDNARSSEWPEMRTRVVGTVPANDGTRSMVNGRAHFHTDQTRLERPKTGDHTAPPQPSANDNAPVGVDAVDLEPVFGEI